MTYKQLIKNIKVNKSVLKRMGVIDEYIEAQYIAIKLISNISKLEEKNKKMCDKYELMLLSAITEGVEVEDE